MNTFTTASQRHPGRGGGRRGDFVVVWQSYGQDGSHYRVSRTAVRAPPARPQGVEFQVNSFTTGPQRDPAVAMNDAGDFVVAWQSYLQDGSFYGIFGQRYSAAGTALGTEFPVNAVTDNNQVVAGRRRRRRRQLRRGVGGQGRGRLRLRHLRTALRFRRRDAGGQFRANTRTHFQQRNPAIAANDAGEFVVTWHSYDQDGSLDGVFGQRYSPAGNRRRVNSRSTPTPRNGQMLSTVAADEEGRFVVAWRSCLQDGSTYGVYGRRVASLRLRRRLRNRRRLRLEHCGRGRLPVDRIGSALDRERAVENCAVVVALRATLGLR